MLKRLLRGRSPLPTQVQESARLEFDDPILGSRGLDMAAILAGMQITMQNGTIKTAIERVSEALRPIAVSHLIPDPPVDPELLNQSEKVIAAERNNLPCTRLIGDADGDREVASAASVINLTELVKRQYADALAPVATDSSGNYRILRDFADTAR